MGALPRGSSARRHRTCRAFPTPGSAFSPVTTHAFCASLAPPPVVSPCVAIRLFFVPRPSPSLARAAPSPAPRFPMHCARSRRAGRCSPAPRSAAASAAAAQRAQGRASERTSPPSLPASVMIGLQRAHVPLSSISVVVAERRRPQPLVALNAGPADDARLDDEARHHLRGPVDLGPDYRWRTSAYADGEVDAQRRPARQSVYPGHGRSEARAGRTDRPRRTGFARTASRVSTARWCSTSATSTPPRATCRLRRRRHRAVQRRPGPAAVRVQVAVVHADAERPTASRHRRAAAARAIADRQRIARHARRLRGALPAASPSVAQTNGGFVQASFIGDYPLRCGPRTINVAALDHSTFFAGGFLALWKQAGGTFNGTTREGADAGRARGWSARIAARCCRTSFATSTSSATT